MDYFFKNGDICLKQEDFDLDETLDCGQAFRWKKTGLGYYGFYINTPLEIIRGHDYFLFKNTTEEEFLHVWAEYFDLYTDYGELKRIFSEDETLSKACKFAGGIRLLKQDKWEALCSFIISQNNNIPRIKGIIDRMCNGFGEFPTPLAISRLEVSDLDFLRAGFRGKYILDGAKRIASGEIDLELISKMELPEARKKLQTIVGVGPKVAECALLYGMYRVEAFPMDVWIKRVMEKYYKNGIPNDIIPYAGIAQQFLFHYIRKFVEN